MKKSKCFISSMENNLTDFQRTFKGIFITLILRSFYCMEFEPEGKAPSSNDKMHFTHIQNYNDDNNNILPLASSSSDFRNDRIKILSKSLKNLQAISIAEKMANEKRLKDNVKVMKIQAEVKKLYIKFTSYESGVYKLQNEHKALENTCIKMMDELQNIKETPTSTAENSKYKESILELECLYIRSLEEMIIMLVNAYDANEKYKEKTLEYYELKEEMDDDYINALNDALENIKHTKPINKISEEQELDAVGGYSVEKVPETRKKTMIKTCDYDEIMLKKCFRKGGNRKKIRNSCREDILAKSDQSNNATNVLYPKKVYKIPKKYVIY